MNAFSDASRILSPVRTRPARMAPLAKLPVFFDIAGRSVLVAGSGEAAAWKVELLLAAGAKVTLVSERPHAEMRHLAASYAERAILHERKWCEYDLDGVALAVMATERDEEAAIFAAACRCRKVPVNIIDRPDFCDFQFGAVVNRSPAIVAIGTDGAAPVLAQAIRRRIEALLPVELGGWTALAKGFRERLARMLPDRLDRRRFWEWFADACFSRPVPADVEPLAAMAAAIGREKDGVGNCGRGEVILVGAGPGDAGLMTLAGMRALQMADVVIYDRLVTEEVLELCRREARRVLVGKKGHGAACRQEEIDSLIVAEAMAGNIVVRLKGGDPAVFGRTGEEIAACRSHGIPVRIVPGITGASAAAAAFGIPLTHRDHGRRLQFISGHDRNGALPEDIDIDALADRKATTCIYMPMHTLPQLSRRLLARGMSAATPALLARSVGWPEQTFRVTTLGALVSEGCASDVSGPGMVIIGTIVAA